ncbi:hypothetical protein TURU_035978 [Turdus rufiventris]|nr:hypothetical protein TURU_035978 [Turdus rufiventris]
MKEEKSTKGVGKYEYDLMWILEEEEEEETTTTTILIPVKDSEFSCLAIPTPPRLKPLAQRNSRRVTGFLLINLYLRDTADPGTSSKEPLQALWEVFESSAAFPGACKRSLANKAMLEEKQELQKHKRQP